MPSVEKRNIKITLAFKNLMSIYWNVKYKNNVKCSNKMWYSFELSSIILNFHWTVISKRHVICLLNVTCHNKVGPPRVIIIISPYDLIWPSSFDCSPSGHQDLFRPNKGFSRDHIGLLPPYYTSIRDMYERNVLQKCIIEMYCKWTGI